MDNLTVIIPYRNGAATVERLLDSLPKDIPVIVADDQSTAPYQTHRPNVRAIRLDARGYFSGAVNRGISECQTDVLILNQDVWFDSPHGPVPGKVLSLATENFTVDFNHPLAGKNLNFQLTLVGVTDQPTQPVSCGCGCGSDPSDCGSSGCNC